MQTGQHAGRHRGVARLVFTFGCWLLLIWANTSLAQSDLEARAERQVSSAFATALVLTDGEAISFGAVSFDPDQFVSFGDDFGSEESLRRRRSVRTFTLPGEWQLGPEDDKQRLRPFVEAGINYYQAEQDVVFADEDDPARDRSEDRVYGAYGGAGLSHQLTDKWQARLGANLHLMRYDNDYQYNHPVSQASSGEADELLFNGDATAAIGEVETRFVYSDKVGDFPWRFQSIHRYYGGATVDNEGLEAATPETWTWKNGLSLRWPLAEIFDRRNRLRLFLHRVDIGGDAREPMGTSNYYEFGVGWLFDLSGGPEWLDNLGARITLNTGSALSGGSVALLYNEEF